MDPGTGLLVSSFTLDGRPKDGPEGSSIWMTAHCLQLIDEEFAADQYRRARKELGREVLGFSATPENGRSRGWGRKTWTRGRSSHPGRQCRVERAGLPGRRAFDDRAYFRGLQASVDFAAFPSEHEGRLRYCAGNQVGDAVLLYAAVLGPLWDEVRKKTRGGIEAMIGRARNFIVAVAPRRFHPARLPRGCRGRVPIVRGLPRSRMARVHGFPLGQCGCGRAGRSVPRTGHRLCGGLLRLRPGRAHPSPGVRDLRPAAARPASGSPR